MSCFSLIMPRLRPPQDVGGLHAESQQGLFGEMKCMAMLPQHSQDGAARAALRCVRVSFGRHGKTHIFCVTDILEHVVAAAGHVRLVCFPWKFQSLWKQGGCCRVWRRGAPRRACREAAKKEAGSWKNSQVLLCRGSSGAFRFPWRSSIMGRGSWPRCANLLQLLENNIGEALRG